jgi:hypothetical protein
VLGSKVGIPCGDATLASFHNLGLVKLPEVMLHGKVAGPRRQHNQVDSRIHKRKEPEDRLRKIHTLDPNLSRERDSRWGRRRNYWVVLKAENVALARAPLRYIHNFVIDDHHADQQSSWIGFDRPRVNDLASATPFRRGLTGDFLGNL